MYGRAAAIILTLAVATLPACGDEPRASLSGRWQATGIEWEQDGRSVRLGSDGRMRFGRLELTREPATFRPMVEAMQTVTVEMSQSEDGIQGRVTSTDRTPRELLRQIGATPGSVLARFEGAMIDDTSGAVVVTTVDGRRREVRLRVEDGGRRIVARAVPVFGEDSRNASDIVLAPAAD